MLASLASLSYAPTAAAAGPTGSYSGSKSILGEQIAATLNFNSASSVDVTISGAASVNCKAEAYTGTTDLSLTNIDKSGDCVHDALATAPEKVSIEDIKYDAGSDTITVTAKASILKVSFELTKSIVESSEAEAQNVQYPTVAEHAEWFEAFKTKFGKEYATPAEHKFRFGIFRENLAIATARNAEGEARHGVTKFSDLTQEEFKAMYLGYKAKADAFADAVEEAVLPKLKANSSNSIDWRTKTPKVLTPVKDQGQCGSCWAFSATEQIETDAALATGKLITLSPQQITSCDKQDLGCNGGNTETAYAYVKKAGGLEPNSDYPYTSGRTGRSGTCEAEKSEEAVSITGYSSVSKSGMSEGKMVSQIQKSPISVCVDAEKWQTYTSGVIGRSCGSQLDHCVQAVGLNTMAGKSYWIVRNSWNTDWGEDGYIYVQEGINACGIAKDATIVKGASTVKNFSPIEM